MTPTADDIRAYANDPAKFFSALVIPSARGQKHFGECMAEFQRQRFASIVPALLAVARGECPTIGKHWWEATKGASKDSDLACCLLWLLAFTSRPLAMQVGAADQDQADELRKAAKSILRLNPWLTRRVRINNWQIVSEATASECEIIAADIAGSHGARPDVLVLNELSHVQKWEFAENLLDNASKVPQGLVVIATNAGLIGTPAWKWRELARTSARWSFQQYAQPSPWLDQAEISEARIRNSTARFNRLWHGVWASGSGDALDPADIEAAIDRSMGPLAGTPYISPRIEAQRRNPLLPRMELVPEPPPRVRASDPSHLAGITLVAGLDLGVKNDHSALVVLAANHRTQRIRLALAQSWARNPETRQVDLGLVEESVAEACDRYRLAGVYFDPFQAALMAQRLAKRNVRMVEVPFTGKHLDKMATTLMEVFRSRRIDLYPHDRLVADLRRLSIEEKSYGHRLTATRDADGHCDLGTALAIALPAAVELAGQLYGPGSVISLDFDPRQPQSLIPSTPASDGSGWGWF